MDMTKKTNGKRCNGCRRTYGIAQSNYRPSRRQRNYNSAGDRSGRLPWPSILLSSIAPGHTASPGRHLLRRFYVSPRRPLSAQHPKPTSPPAVVKKAAAQPSFRTVVGRRPRRRFCSNSAIDPGSEVHNASSEVHGVDSEVHGADPPSPEQPHEQPVVRKSTGQRQTSTYLKDYICHNSIVRTSPHDITKVLSYARLSHSF
nr:uncharacterized protein LOC109166016 [Ipomoea batatas]